MHLNSLKVKKILLFQIWTFAFVFTLFYVLSNLANKIFIFNIENIIENILIKTIPFNSKFEYQIYSCILSQPQKLNLIICTQCLIFDYEIKQIWSNKFLISLEKKILGQWASQKTTLLIFRKNTKKKHLSQ